MGTLKTNEEIKKEISEAMEELSWVVEGGDAHDLQDACDKAHACLADTLALIERLESDASFYKNISALMDKTNKEALSLIDSLIESNLKRGEKIEQLKAQNAELSKNIMWMEAERDDLKRTIQELQAEIEEYEEAANKCCYESQCNAELNCLEALCKRLKDENEQLQAERDAVMRDMTKNCASCKYAGCNNPGSDGCPHVEQCQNYGKWEWRGIPKED